ncbi:MAG: hypothetical protein Q8Q09_08600 [Deltaproteobacteria bacterium]|nr:hypothetical protein [Deltaproteobacteria bacterium]
MPNVITKPSPWFKRFLVLATASVTLGVPYFASDGFADAGPWTGFDSAANDSTIPDPTREDTAPSVRTRGLALAARAASDSDKRNTCRGSCGSIGDGDLRNFCRGNCGSIGDSDTRNFCRESCGSIGNGDMRNLCRGDCGSIGDGDLRNFCRGNCGSINDGDLRNYCRGSCGSI